jgi:hypothetical protein
MDIGYREIRNHEAAHAVVAILLEVPFNRVDQYEVHFPIEAASSPNYKTVIAAGCLGEFYEQWVECENSNELRRERGIQPIDCTTPINIALERFNKKNYKKDFIAFTNGGDFDKAEYERYLQAAWPIVKENGDKIIEIGTMLQLHKEMTYADVTALVN